ncbi:hypothetical protein POM88_037432 [Heracleum sosnowskyi]|uniref:NmrA-like domain-containing protein n=1 Tax=Heracleum sosnowskyi TaxID=360622 RepID=A0AAD8MDA1_9APIA|nr:hypothetical protein POM88_037432 [Heracleum sosnowskyi]
MMSGEKSKIMIFGATGYLGTYMAKARMPSYLEQLKIIIAMKEAGNIKRFIPSEFGNELHKVVYGTGETKFVCNYEKDVAEYTVKVATDPRTENCRVIYRLPKI